VGLADGWESVKYAMWQLSTPGDRKVDQWSVTWAEQAQHQWQQTLWEAQRWSIDGRL